METKFSMPVTGGFFSTDLLIVVGVTIIFVILYVVFGIIRENKNDDLRGFNDNDFVETDENGFSEDDFVRDETEKQ
jgi:hypothetical protein